MSVFVKRICVATWLFYAVRRGADRSLQRLLNRKAAIDDEKLRKLLSLVTEQELRDILGSEILLEAAVNDPVLDYTSGLVIEILRLAAGDEYLRNLLIKFVVENFREDVERALSVVIPAIRLEWSDEFEELLREQKKGRKVTDPDTPWDPRGAQ